MTTRAGASAKRGSTSECSSFPAARRPRRVPLRRASGTAADLLRRDDSPGSRTCPGWDAATATCRHSRTSQGPGLGVRRSPSSSQGRSPTRSSARPHPTASTRPSHQRASAPRPGRPTRRDPRARREAATVTDPAGALDHPIRRVGSTSVRRIRGRGVWTDPLRRLVGRVPLTHRVFRNRRRPATRLLLVTRRHPAPSMRPNRRALRLIAAGPHPNPDRHRQSTRRRSRNHTGMVWPSRGPTATTRRARVTSQPTATPEGRATVPKSPPTISLPLTRPRPNLRQRTNRHTRRATPTPGRMSRQQPGPLPWQAACRWRRTPGVGCTARRTARPTKGRTRSLRHARPNPKHRRRVHRRFRGRRRRPVRDQARGALRQHLSVRRWATPRPHRSVPQRHNTCRRQVRPHVRVRSHQRRSQATVREMARRHRTQPLTPHQVRPSPISPILLVHIRTTTPGTHLTNPRILLDP